MRLVALVLALVAVLATPVKAAPPARGTMLGRFVQKRRIAVAAKVDKLRSTWKDPVARKLLFGRAATTGLLIGAGQVVDLYLRHEGLPPVVAAFAAGALPAYASHAVQRGLHAVRKDVFVRPAKSTLKQRLGDALFAGIVGLGAKVGLDQLGHAFHGTPLGDALAGNSNKAAALGRVGTPGVRWFTTTVVKRGVMRLVGALRYGARQIGDFLVGQKADRTRSKLRSQRRSDAGAH